jgi:hypothetical protein
MTRGEAILNRSLILTNRPTIMGPGSMRFRLECVIRKKLSMLEYYNGQLIKSWKGE